LQCSVSSLLIKLLKPWVLLEFFIEFGEPVERVLVVLRGPLDEDIHPEVGLGHLFLVLLLVLVGHAFTLALELALHD
jgi:hypothetical protein